MDSKQLARAEAVIGTEDGPLVVGILCAHNETLASPQHQDRLVALVTYLRPSWTAADILGILANLQASPTRAEFEELMARFLDNLLAQAMDEGRIIEDDAAEEQMIGLSYLVLSALSTKVETPLGDQDLRHGEMVALLSGIQLVDDGHAYGMRAVH